MVLTRAPAYSKVWRSTGIAFENVPLQQPPLEFATRALWTDIPLSLKRALDNASMDCLAGCHGAAHAVNEVLPLFVLCGRADVGTECPSPLQRRARPIRFIIYDRQPGGGVGIAAAAFAAAPSIYAAALSLVESCACEDGCPSCIWDSACRGGNHVLDKRAAAAVLRYALFGTHP